MNEVPLFQARKEKEGEWIVAAKWPSGHSQDFKGFTSESLANEWIAKKLQTWLDENKEQPVDA
jgi:hypothetical protein